MIRAIIIDDERESAELLALKVKRYCQEVEVQEVCLSPVLGMAAITKHKPDLVFLDIEMPGMSGFGLLEKLQPVDFAVIFTTAYDHYAIKAIRFAALDYLLKPVDVEELVAAVSRLDVIGANLSVGALLNGLKQDGTAPEKLVLHTADSLEYVNLTDIIRCESDGTYTTFYLKGGKRVLVSKNIGEYEALLAGSGFFRVHTSHLINIRQVESFIKEEGGQVKLSDGSLIDVSRRRKDEFLQVMQKL